MIHSRCLQPLGKLSETPCKQGLDPSNRLKPASAEKRPRNSLIFKLVSGI